MKTEFDRKSQFKAEARKESNLPEWARIGEFRYCSLYCGPIEVEKTYLTRWDEEHIPMEAWMERNKDLVEYMGGTYSKYGDTVIKLLKEAHINWITIIWSNGFSLGYEEENRRIGTEFIRKCHENGIKVSAYISITNMFWEEMFIDEPQSIAWVRMEDGKPVTYGDRKRRFLADINNKSWREYIKRRTSLAIDAGVDGLWYDNFMGDEAGILSLIQEMRMLANEKKGDNKIVITPNAHVWSTGLWKINEICDTIRDEGFNGPGIVDGNIVTCATIFRFMSCDGGRWKPFFVRMSTPGGVELAIFEAAAFQAFLRPELPLQGIIEKQKESQEYWKSVAKYYSFLESHKEYYTSVVPLAKLAVLDEYEKGTARKAYGDILIRSNVMFEFVEKVKLAESRLSTYKALMIPDIKDLNSEEVSIIERYLKDGGKILLFGRCERLTDALRVKYEGELKVENKFGIFYPDVSLLSKAFEEETARRNLLQEIGTLTGNPLIEIVGSNYIMSNIVRKKNQNQIILHLLNYSENEVEYLNVILNLKGFCEKEVKQMRVFSPEEVPKEIKHIVVDRERIKFSVPKIRKYCLVVIDY